MEMALFLECEQLCHLNQMKLLRWRHNEPDGISNHRRPDCLLNRLFMRRLKETSKLCEGNLPWPVNFPHKGPVTREMFPLDNVIMKYQ